MKKILMFSFLLATSTISYSSLQNSTVEGTMNITATIITPLTIQADKDLDFGNILPSAVNHAFSSFTIKGEKNARVKISFNDLASNGASFIVPIHNNKGDYFDITFNCTPSNNPGDLLNHANNLVTLTDNGELILNIAATAQPRKDQTSGKYKGQITLRATYE